MKKIPHCKKSSWAIWREVHKDFIEFRDNLLITHNDIVYCKLWYQDLIVINNPAYIKHVLYDNYRNYSKVTKGKILEKLFGKYSLVFTNDHQQWVNDKKVMMPSFQPAHYQNYAKIFVNNCQKMMDGWNSFANKNQPINIDAMMTELTLKNLLQALFGNISIEEQRFSELMYNLSTDIEAQLKSLLGLRWKLPTPSRAKFYKNLRELHGIAEDIIKTRQGETGQENNLLSMMIKAYENESDQNQAREKLKSQLLTMISAGHETTTAALDWIWVVLSYQPEVTKKLREEIDSVLNGRTPTLEDLPNMPYLRGVVLETLRLFPPASGLLRTAVEDDELDGYRIPANTMINIAITSVHKRPEYWENPEGFNPERFFTINLKDEYLYAYLPFGAGPRICIGKDFSIIQMSLIVITILQKYLLYLPANLKIKIEPRFIYRPQMDLPMYLKKV